MFSDHLSVSTFETTNQYKVQPLDLELDIAILLINARFPSHRLLYKLVTPSLMQDLESFNHSDLIPLGEVQNIFRETKTVVLANNDIVHCEHLILASSCFLDLQDTLKEIRQELNSNLNTLIETLQGKGKSYQEQLKISLAKIATPHNVKLNSIRYTLMTNYHHSSNCLGIEKIAREKMAHDNPANSPAPLSNGAAIFF